MRKAYPVLVSLLLVMIVGLQMWHFEGEAYREDEAWVVHGTMERTPAEMLDWIAINTDPPGHTYLLRVWVQLTGHHEVLTRYFSVLFTLAGLAWFYRLTVDALGHRTALAGVFLLGTLNFFLFYTHETRPYAALFCWVMGMHWALNRLLQAPRRLYVAVFLGCGVLALYTHYFAALYVAALAFYIALFEPWYRRRYWPIIGYFALLTLSLSAWVVFAVFVYNNPVLMEGGIPYSLSATGWQEALQLIYRAMQPDPASLGMLLLLAGFLVPVSRRHTPPGGLLSVHNRLVTQAIFIPAVLLLMAFGINTVISSLTPRNLINILPLLAILAARTLTYMPWRISLIAILFFAVSAVTGFTRVAPNLPYYQLMALMETHHEPNEPIIMESQAVWPQIPILYYLQERTDLALDNALFTHFALPPAARPYNGISYPSMPDPPLNWLNQAGQLPEIFADPDNLPDTVWWMAIGADIPQSDRTEAFMDDQYILQHHYPLEPPDWYLPHQVYEYRLIPDDSDRQYTFGENIGLYQWQVNETQLQPCQRLELETWWQTAAPLDENYSLTMVLADESGNGRLNADGSPADILTGLWQPEQFYLDERSLTLPCDLPPGEYPLLTGIYQPETDERLPVRDSSGNPRDGLLYLTTIHVR